MATVAAVSIVDPLALALVDMSLRGLLLFAAASVVSFALVLGRASAAARHFVWVIAITAALAMPLLGLVLPSWTMRLSTAGPKEFAPAHASADSLLELAVADIGAANPQGNALPVEPMVAHRELVESIPQLDSARRPSTAVLSDDVSDGLRWQPIVVGTWALGVVVTLLPVLFGSLSLRRLRRSSRVASDGRCLRMFNELCGRMSVKRRVILMLTDRRTIPMTWGMCRPVVLLPTEAAAWPNERLRAVLLHELAHVQRCDCFVQWIAQFARAVHWCNPLAWLAVSQLHCQQESACDDRVMRSGLLAADYAEHLLAVASQRPQYRLAAGVALAMARSSRIDRRLRSILDPGRNRRDFSRRRAVATTAVALGLIVPFATATIRFEARGEEPIAAKADANEKAESNQQSSAERLAELRRRLVDQYVTPPNEEQVLRGAIKGMVESLNDPYSEYLPADKLAELERQIEGKLTGIGAQLERSDGRITVVTPLEGSPALTAGVQPGDAITEIDGQSTREMELTDAVKRIVGESGTKVRLKVRREPGESIELTIERGPIVLRSVKGFQRGGEQRWEFMLNREHKIGYLAIDQFGPRTAGELKEAITGLREAGLKGLILDLRFSPGGLLQAAYEAAQLFLGEATVVTIRGRDGEEKAWKSDGTKQLGDFPLVVLVNEQTASATEVLAGALKDNKRAILVGARTFGKGSVQSLIKLDNDAGAIRLTTAFYHSPSGRRIDRVAGEKVWGVDPSDGYFVPMTQEATERLNKRRREREILGEKTSADKTPIDSPTARAIAEDHGDPQLSAGLRTLVARVVSGDFERVGQSAEMAQEYALRRMEVDHLRREALTRRLERLDREWRSLDQVRGGDAAKPK